MYGVPYYSAMTNTNGWTRSGNDYNNAFYNRFEISTNRLTFYKEDRDIYLLYYPVTTDQTQWIKRTLGANNLSTWTLSGEAAWVEDSQHGDDFIEVLDNADKVIARINRVDSWPNGAMMANNVTITSGGLNVLYPVFNKLQP